MYSTHAATRAAPSLSRTGDVFLVANFVDIVHLKTVCYARIMKTYQLGTCGDRIVTIKTSGGEHIVTIKLKDSDTKYIELPPKS